MKKYLVLIGDGMAGWPIIERGNKTTLEIANTPNMDYMATMGQIGLVNNVPVEYPPGSDVANLSIFGYDPRKFYTGRAPIEAVSKGLELSPNDTVFRANIITIQDGVMKDFTAGHIPSDRGADLINALNKIVSIHYKDVELIAGISYRNLMVVRNRKFNLKSVPPHDITGNSVKDFLPEGDGADYIKEIMQLCEKEILKINTDNGNNGVSPTNIWLWGQGEKMNLPSFHSKYGLSGKVITAVDLVKGLGVAAGLTYVPVPGITGFVDTNFIGKAKYALEALSECDIVFVHVEAPDESGHMGDIALKVKAIEHFDSEVVGTILNESKFDNLNIVVLPDHETPVKIKTHGRGAVPFIFFNSNDVKIASTKVMYSEKTAKESGIMIEPGSDLMEKFIKYRSDF